MISTTFKLILLIKLALSLTKSNSEGVSPRILNGTVAKIGQFPFMIYIDAIGGISSCTGTLITSQNVLTAAHCYILLALPCDGCKHGISIAGDVFRQKKGGKSPESRQERKVVNVVVHPKAHGQLLLHDIAVLKTETPFSLTKNVAVIPLAKDELKPGQSCISVGFGGQKSDTAKPIATDLAWFISKVSNLLCVPNVICVTGELQSTFPGDSGGPLVDRTNKPSVHGVLSGDMMYSKVKMNKKWIEKHLVKKSRRSSVAGIFQNHNTCILGVVMSVKIQDVILCTKTY